MNGSPVDQASVDGLTDALSHRGPDDRGTYVHENVGLGFRRLSIIDLSRNANQPMCSDDGRYVLVFNGEIYNFQEKRALLESRGYRFRTRSDSEVLLRLYEAFGPGALEHLRGMFAFAVFDRDKGSIFLARDRTGQKPLKFFHHGGVFAFASELKALRRLPACPTEVDEEAMFHFLTMMYLPSPSTGYRDVHKLPAGHAMTLDVASGSYRVERYWSLDYEADESMSAEEWSDATLATLRESVRLRMVADVPVGAFLSGGVDSAAVVALMSENSTAPVKTFSIGSDDPRYNELPEAETIARRFGTDHAPIPLDADIVTLLPELVRTYEEPYADASCIPTYIVSKHARERVTVVLNGDGGDENYAGYVRYPILLFSEAWRRVPRAAHRLVEMMAERWHRMSGTTLSYRALRFQRSIGLPWPRRYLQYLSYFTDDEKRGLLRDARGYGPTDSWYEDLTVEARARAGDTLHQAMSMDVDTYLADDLLPKVDLGTMAHGLEARSPFLDHELLQLTATLPRRYKLSWRQRKILLKRSLSGMLPKETLARPKRGFRLPLDRWFRGELSHFVRDRLLAKQSAMWQFFERPGMETFLSRYFDSRVDMSDHIWALLWLQEWLDSSR